MRYCPDDLDPCRREGCGEGRCQRTGEAPMTSCYDCGVFVTRNAIVVVCGECAGRYGHQLEEEA